MAWLNGQDNWYDCMHCGEAFYANEYHPLYERCEAKKRLGLLKVKRVKRMQRI